MYMLLKPVLNFLHFKSHNSNIQIRDLLSRNEEVKETSDQDTFPFHWFVHKINVHSTLYDQLKSEFYNFFITYLIA